MAAGPSLAGRELDENPGPPCCFTSSSFHFSKRREDAHSVSLSNTLLAVGLVGAWSRARASLCAPGTEGGCWRGPGAGVWRPGPCSYSWRAAAWALLLAGLGARQGWEPGADWGKAGLPSCNAAIPGQSCSQWVCSPPPAGLSSSFAPFRSAGLPGAGSTRCLSQSHLTHCVPAANLITGT